MSDVFYSSDFGPEIDHKESSAHVLLAYANVLPSRDVQVVLHGCRTFGSRTWPIVFGTGLLMELTKISYRRPIPIENFG